MTEDGKTTSVAHWLEEEDFAKNGGVMNHETGESISVVVALSPWTTLVSVILSNMVCLKIPI